MLATLWNGPGGTGFVFALLALISLGFLLRFVLPALILLRQLGRAVGQLEKLAAGGQPADPEVISRQVMVTPRLAHLWRNMPRPCTASAVALSRTRPGTVPGVPRPWPRPISPKRRWWKRR